MSHAAPALPASRSLQPQRIAATSLAMTIHLAAFGLLLAPLARHTPADTPPQRTQVQWQAVELAPPPPPPALPLPVTRSTPTAVAAPAPEPLTLPVLVDHVDSAALVQAASALHQRLDLGLPVPSAASAPAAQSLQLLQAPAPAYPPQALARQLQGEVLLRVHLDAQGKVLAVDIERSSGHRLLDQAARQQVLRRWQFAPASSDGIARPAQGLVPINFRLD